MSRRMTASAATSMTFTSLWVYFGPRAPVSYPSYRLRLNYDNRTKTIDDSIGIASCGSRHRLVEDRASHRPGDQAARRRTGCGGTRRSKHVHDGAAVGAARDDPPRTIPFANGLVGGRPSPRLRLHHRPAGRPNPTPPCWSRD